ncbi:hypothetical protein EV356DRAFT_574490 [Viridothelium virens]|uniref:Rhodopsin domain-containing protein n=1 Tax=Viridothelium virens TaxID=1048519 RepID=A0A6A6HHK2_VIRVR|nr:hypothetical protein EV356DRAFT_574490 [Viridothelium virens]
MIAASLVCQPMAYSWNPSIPGGSCNEDAKNGIYAALCGYTILHNVVIWSIPQVLVWRLPMSTANKIGLSAIFALGILDIGIAIVRLTAILTLNHDDYSYTIAPQQVASVAEVGIAIIVSNAPTMRPAIGACRDKLRTSRRREATSNTSVVQISAGSYEQLGDVNTQLSNDLRPDRGNTATVIEANASTEKTGRSSLSHHFPRRGTDVEQGITVKNEMAITYNK